jgi:hypothetical protein
MKTQFLARLIVAALAVTGITANAATNNLRSKSLVVQSPSDLPVLAQKDSEAMYLHDTGQGTTVLYVEADGGTKILVLDDRPCGDSSRFGSSTCRSFSI